MRDIVLMKLDAVGLRGARDLMPSEVSGGMARRVALARAIALDPDLVMYDEPFAGLDPISLGTAARLIRQLNDTLGLTSIVVSHDLEETFRIADHVIILANGGVAAQGTPRRSAPQRRSAGPPVRQCAARWAGAFPLSRRQRRGRFRQRRRRARDELVPARRRRLRRAQQAGRPRAAARACSCAWCCRGAQQPAPLRPGARPDPFPRQLLAGDHRGVGPVRRLRARPAGLLHAAALRLVGSAGPAGGAEPGARTRARWSRRCCSRAAPAPR